MLNISFTDGISGKDSFCKGVAFVHDKVSVDGTISLFLVNGCTGK